MKPTRKCSIEGCDRPTRSSGWCGAHYARYRRHGDPLSGGPTRQTPPPDGKCEIPGCDRDYYGGGMCTAHYRRNKRHGDPLKGGSHIYATPEDAFEARTEWRGDCLIWTGSANAAGYGRIGFEGKVMLAHRYAWQRANGQIPTGLLIDHICHTPACVNIRHLRLATKSQNGMNRSGADASNKSSGLRNVTRNGSGWMVQLETGRRLHYYGTYSTIAEAAKVAEAARRDLFGQHAGLG